MTIDILYVMIWEWVAIKILRCGCNEMNRLQISNVQIFSCDQKAVGVHLVLVP